MLSPLSFSDSLALVRLPELPFDINGQKVALPAVHDNSGQPYFRPLFEQVSNECGQYAAIAFTFTYEINYTRNSPANIPANQFPTHYTYNFMNGGFGWHGVSYFHSFEIARTNGHPSVEDFGFLNSCGPSFWMSGYDKYYRGMFNKIEHVYQIPVGTPEGLLALKNWLHNHLSGDPVGGLACFYSGTPWNLKILPSGTPEGGKHVITGFVDPATHSSTITGYNDSIRFDYNQDGQYTNHLDINGDGLVNMKDWEIGGLRFTDSYLGGVNWADSGFCYMMYKTLADLTGEGGLWNNVVHVVKIKEDYEPLLSMKVNIRHNCRDRIKIMAGVSENSASGVPGHVLGFPIFDFQGGCQHMQGGWEPESQTLELGLDITPLLGRIRSDQEAGFFLLVYESDPENYGTGKIVDFSVIDHMHNDQEYSFPVSNVALVENGLTLIGVPATLSFDELTITTDPLPVALTGEPYNHQLTATGGTPPYNWNLVRHYSESSGPALFPSIDQEKLEPPDTLHSKVMKKLEFGFPFYGESFDSVWVHTDGFIMFDDMIYPWPYLYDEHLMIRKTRILAPMLNNFLYIHPSGDQGIWYEGNEQQAAFRWKMSATFPAGKEYEFAVVLFADGTMEFYYKTGAFVQDHTWAAGISAGDGINYQYPSYGGFKSSLENKMTVLAPAPFPGEMSLTKAGLFSGIPQKNYPGIDLVIDITDANLLNQRKTLKFHSYVAGVDDLRILPAAFVNLWPNPAGKHLNIEFFLKEVAEISFSLEDPAGKSLQTTAPKGFPAGMNRLSLDLSAVKPGTGMYYLVFRMGNQLLHAEKIVLLK